MHNAPWDNDIERQAVQQRNGFLMTINMSSTAALAAMPAKKLDRLSVHWLG